MKQPETSTANPKRPTALPPATGSVKRVPFTIICPEIKPGQGIKTREISVEVREEYGEDILTSEAMELIETIKMQMMLTRLVECVRELYAATGVLPSRDPKATGDVTAQGCTNSPNAPGEPPARENQKP